MLPRCCKLRSDTKHEAHQRDLWLHWSDIEKVFPTSGLMETYCGSEFSRERQARTTLLDRLK